ncbi:MAG: right-handed parallel beta-helix repeat-containing protein [Ignavibacteria bacterium]|jgi:hypothetical protein|nr:right-handed parallel beta-helix repeat-containing protein [Ignavibacteria bacterium]MDH7527465.1 right-handed parallel beta-helix repeat-containing protein [Ignavibacteria bacterium]
MKSFYLLLIPLIFLINNPSFAQLSGTYSIPGDYASISAAVNDLNSQGVGSGGVTFNVDAGYTENITAPITITATGTASNPIVFQKSGSGANPLITRTDGGTLNTSTIGGAGDAVIRLEGTDYITFDGIDIATSNQGIEYGYLTHKPSGTDGCQYVNIRNCTIDLTKGTSGYVIGIYIGNGTTSTSSAVGVTVSANSGRNQNITISGVTIQDVHAGIYVRGSSATGFYDTDITIGTSGAGNGVVIQNFGGGNASATYGVYFIYVNNPIVEYTTISSANHNSTLYGIFYSIVTGNVVGSNNSITLNNTSTSSGTNFIYNGNAVTSENFNNNNFAANTISSTGTVYLIYASNSTPNKSISGNSVSSITRGGTSGSLYCYYNLGSPSSGTETISNNNFSNISVTGTSSLYGIYTNTATGQNRVCSGNTISNLTGGSGSTYAIYAASSNSNQIYNNNVSGITANGTVYGIYFSGTNPTVYNNTVSNITTAGSILYGIYNAGTGTTNCYQNQIYGLSNTNSTPTLYGIYITTGTSNYVYNNFISDLKTLNSSSLAGLAGIYISNGTYIGIYYNTIYLNASSSGTNFGSSGIYASTTPTVDLRNNIVVNTSTPNGTGLTVAYRRSSTTLTTYSSNSNNNLFYAGTPGANSLIFYDGTNSDQTISAFKSRVAPRDASSFTEMPPFVDISATPYNLHINTSTATQIESGGTPISSPIAINMDFDGDSRNDSAPDVGADEFSGTPLDLSPPSISYSPLGNGIVDATRSFTNVVITDPSGVNTTSGYKPRVYFKKSTDPNDDTGWKYVEADNSSSPFNFTLDYSLLNAGNVSIGDTIQYFVVAQDLAPTPNVGINSGSFANPQSSVDLQTDAFPIGGTINKYAIVGTISGTFTVGTGGDYPSLTGAGGLFEDINNKVVTGNITAQIISDLTETGANALNQWSEAGTGGYTLTIVPSAATNRNISGSYTGALIRLNGADRVTIDGRYGGSGNYLTISNTASSGTIAAIQLISSGVGQGCENIVIRNCNISNGYIGTSTYGIFVGSSTLGTGAADNDNITIRDNNIYKSYYGIYVVGVSGGTCDNLQILNNEIGSNTPADYVYKYGIYASYINNSDISGNHIFNMSSTTATPVGIYLYTGVTNSTISKNRIHNIAYTGTSGFGGWGMYVNTGNASSNLTIHTNVIYEIKGDGYLSYSNSSMVGIYIDGTTGGLNIYYNSVNLFGDFAGYNTATLTAAMLFNTSTITNVDLRNNVFVNTMNNTTVTTDKNYAIYSTTAAGNFTNINYNDYFVSGSEGVLGYIGGADKTTLAAWQAATGQDANSISSNPSFVANDDLRPSAGSPVLNAGTPITGITTDFLGDARDASPSMGAYENPFIPATPPNCPNLTSPANSATGVSATPTLQWTDGGGGTTGYKLYFGTDNPPTNIHNGTDLGNVTSYTFGSALNYSTTYYWKIVSYNNNGDASGCEIRSFTTVSDPTAIPLHLTFDPVDFPPFGWSNVQGSGTGLWARSTSGSNPTTSPKSGAGMAYFNSFNFSSGTSAMLISPSLNIPNDNYRVYFWMYRDNGYSSKADRVDVYINTTNDTTGGTLLGTINRSSSLPPTVSSNGWYKYEFNLAPGTSGNGRYIIICARSEYGNNIFIDELGFQAIPAATNSQTIGAGSTDPIQFTGTGATVQFTVANSGALNITAEKINSSPGGALPTGLQNLAPTYWAFSITSGTLNGTFSLTLDITGIPGVNNPSQLHLLRRSNPTANWTDLGTPNNVNGNLLTWTGLTSFSEYGLGGDNNNPLPVQLSSFTADVKGRDVQLRWQTATEINNAGFEVERKKLSEGEKQSSMWEKIGYVRGNGNSNRPIDYTYTDSKLNSGKYSYRLKMVDYDGSFEYSDEVQVEIGKPAITKLEQNYPNSFNPTTMIEYQLSNPSRVVLEVYNITGQRVASLVNEEQEAGYYNLIFDANRYGLSSGVYFYRMVAIDRVNGQRFVQTKKMLYLK